MLLQAEQMHKRTSISLQMIKIVILNENSCCFVSRLACNNSNFLLSLRKVISEMAQLPKENEDSNFDLKYTNV